MAAAAAQHTVLPLRFERRLSNVTASELAEVLGISRSRVVQLEGQARCRPATRERYRKGLEAALRRRLERLVDEFADDSVATADERHRRSARAVVDLVTETLPPRIGELAELTGRVRARIAERETIANIARETSQPRSAAVVDAQPERKRLFTSPRGGQPQEADVLPPRDREQRARELREALRREALPGRRRSWRSR